MFSELLACLSTHLPYCANGWSHLNQVLVGGTPLGRAAQEMAPSPLRELLLERPEIWEKAKATQSWCRENHALILYPGHESYPERFFDLPQPPMFLSVWGEARWNAYSTLGIVGGREPTLSAIKWLEEHLLSALRKAPLMTVSGGARGIDQAAHRVSLRALRPTIAFLPTGLSKIYPGEFTSWRDAIVSAGGAMISEYSPEMEIRRANFHRRNRMIAALSDALLVAEAARKSGSLITARYAIELHRPICVLPASAMEPKALGTLDLLFDGASPIRDADDLLTFVGEPRLAPSSTECRDGSKQEDCIWDPHCHERRQLSLSREALGG